MGTLDSREYDRLKARGFKPYSAGHRAMYEIAIQEIKAAEGTADIFEAGFGIGWGLEAMLGAGIVNTYVGCEPQVDSYNYTEGQVTRNWPKHEGIWLRHEPFGPVLAEDLTADGVAPFEFAFCIEVIEHVVPAGHLRFLQELRRLAPVLYFSTPDIDKVPKEGVRTRKEWEALLHEAGYESVQVNTNHWTYLYTCR